jgi:4-hydroxybenzoate polyprenyltransferase
MLKKQGFSKTKRTNQNLFIWAFFTSRPIGWLVSLIILFGFLAIPNHQSLDEVSLLFWLQILSFTFPFNFVFYGINDWFDKESDQKNIRKQKTQWFGAIALDNVKPLIFISIFCLIFGISVSILTFNIYNIILVMACILLGFAYSIPPIRFKSRLFLDILTSGIGYVLIPFHIGYTFDGVFRFNTGILAIFLMLLAMHLGAAYLDIDSDKKAGHITTATILGKNISPILTVFLFVASAILYHKTWFYSLIALILTTSCVFLITKNPKYQKIATYLILFYLIFFLIWRFVVALFR